MISGKVKVLGYTVNPLFAIGQAASICWGNADADKFIDIAEKCYCNRHYRVLEYADVTLELDGYSTKVIRELYTHVIGTSRLQESTRYVDCSNFNMIVPDTIGESSLTQNIFDNCVADICETYNNLIKLGVPKEDASYLLPLGHSTKVVIKINVRALLHLAELRMCTRALHEFRYLLQNIKAELYELGEEWETIASWLKPKCEVVGYCEEQYSCGNLNTRG